MQNETYSKPKILVVDDEETYLRTLRRILRKDFQVLTANSGYDGIEVLKQNKELLSYLLKNILQKSNFCQTSFIPSFVKAINLIP